MKTNKLIKLFPGQLGKHVFWSILSISLFFISIGSFTWFYSAYSHFERESKKMEQEIITPYIEKLKRVVPNPKDLDSELATLIEKSRKNLKNEFKLNLIFSLPVILSFIVFSFWFSKKISKNIDAHISTLNQIISDKHHYKIDQEEIEKLYFAEIRTWVDLWKRNHYEKHRTVNLLQEAEEKIALFYHNQDFLVWCIDSEYKIRFYNQGFANLFGRQFGRVQLYSGIPFLDALTSLEEKKEWKQIFQEGFKEKNLYREIVLDGKQFAVSLHTFSKREGLLAFLGKEITSEREKEYKIQEREKRLDASFSLLPNAIFLLGLEGSILKINPAGLKDFAYETEKELIGKDINSLFSEKEKLAFEKIISELIDKKQEKIHTKAIAVDKQGKEFAVEVQLGFWKDPSDNPVGVILTLVDLSQKELAEKETNKTLAKSQLLQDSLRSSVATMKQEVQTILHRITEIAKEQRYERREQDTLSSWQEVETLGKSSLEFLDYISNIHNGSNDTSTHVAKETSGINPGAVLRDIRNILFREWQKQGQNIELSLANGLPETVLVSQDWLEQILLNLGRFALKTIPQGKLSLTGYSEKVPDSHVLVYLYFRFSISNCSLYKTEKNFLIESLRIAMDKKSSLQANLPYLIARLAQSMQADLVLEEGEDTATVLLCLPKIETVPLSEPLETGAIDWTSISFEKSLVLVAEDLDLSRKLIKEYLQGSAITLLEARDGKQAINYAEKHLPDLVLMDIRMPKINGIEAAKHLKNNQYLKHIPILFLLPPEIGSGNTESIGEGFIRKPVHKRDLVVELARFLPFSV
ncbi:MAG: PAS domain S-box protein [Spirochaetota bacterium]